MQLCRSNEKYRHHLRKEMIKQILGLVARRTAEMFLRTCGDLFLMNARKQN